MSDALARASRFVLCDCVSLHWTSDRLARGIQDSLQVQKSRLSREMKKRRP